MIKEFAKRILFVPRSWLNAVARWIQGVHSPNGTISIRNTVNPGSDGSLALDVNLDRVIAAVRDRFGLETQLDRNSVRDIVWDMVDGASIIVDGRRIAVSKDWLENYISQSAAVTFETSVSNLKASNETPSLGSSNKVVHSDHVHPLSYPTLPASPTDLNCGNCYPSGASSNTIAGTVSDECGGFVMWVCTSASTSGTFGYLHFRRMVISRDGRIKQIDAASTRVTICQDV